jgi:hypothetical protein
LSVIGGSAIDIMRNGNNMFKNVAPLMALASNAKALVSDLPAVLPELRDLDQNEAAELAAAAYECFKGIVDRLQIIR